MRVLFYFYAQDLGNIAIGTLFENLVNNGWQQGILTNTSRYFFRQGIYDYIILSPENESNNFLNLLNGLKQALRLQNQQIYIWLIVHHARAEVQYNREYIGEAERNVINYPCHIHVRDNNFCYNAIRSCSHDFTTLLSACGYSQDNPHLSLRDPLIIIFTEEEYKEWEKAGECKRKANAYDDNINPLQGNKINSPRIIEFKTDNYTILFVKENGLAIKDNKVGADELLNKILDKWGEELNLKNKKEDIYVAVHALNDYIKDKKQFEDKVHYICYFHHVPTEPDKSFCDLLVDVINNINQGKKEEAEKNCDEIIEKIKILAIRPIKALSVLKHKIAHLFLPLSVDLQALEELKENPEKRREYAKEILKEYKDRGEHPFLQLLADLQFLVAGVKKINIYGKNVSTSLTEENLPEKKSVLDLMRDVKKQLPKECEYVLILKPSSIGSLSKSSKEVSKLEEIKQFLDKMDKALGKFKKNEDEGITEFLKIVDDDSKNFHEWLKKLNECLDELREQIEKKEGEAK